MAQQLVFDLAGIPRLDRDDFLVSTANRPVADLLDAWPHWPGTTVLLIGPAGSGKTHLATIWARDVGATIVTGSIRPGMWAGCGRCVVLEDCDRHLPDEAELFHALNLAGETDGTLLVTARSPPSSWGIATPDLLSRLRLATAAALAPPDEETIRAVLLKLFSDRQIRIDADVIGYAARHCEQSLEAVNQFVAAIDEAALASGRRITRPLAAQVLSRLSQEGDHAVARASLR